MKRTALATTGLLFLFGVAMAADRPQYQYGPDSGILPQSIPTWVDAAGAPNATSPLKPLPVSSSSQGVVALTPGTATPALRAVGFVITTAGTFTLTLADGSSITLTYPVGGFTRLDFAVTMVTLGTAAGQFWNLK